MDFSGTLDPNFTSVPPNFSGEMQSVVDFHNQPGVGTASAGVDPSMLEFGLTLTEPYVPENEGFFPQQTGSSLPPPAGSSLLQDGEESLELFSPEEASRVMASLDEQGLLPPPAPAQGDGSLLLGGNGVDLPRNSFLGNEQVPPAVQGPPNVPVAPFMQPQAWMPYHGTSQQAAAAGQYPPNAPVTPSSLPQSSLPSHVTPVQAAPATPAAPRFSAAHALFPGGFRSHFPHQPSGYLPPQPPSHFPQQQQQPPSHLAPQAPSFLPLQPQVQRQDPNSHLTPEVKAALIAKMKAHQPHLFTTEIAQAFVAWRAQQQAQAGSSLPAAQSGPSYLRQPAPPSLKCNKAGAALESLEPMTEAQLRDVGFGGDFA